jgi:hypothetical protein
MWCHDSSSIAEIVFFFLLRKHLITLRTQVGDQVLEVDGVTTDGLTLEQLKASIAGLRGSLVPRGDEGERVITIDR